MSKKVDPFIQPIPRAWSQDRELRSYIEYLHRFLFDLWSRTGGGDDQISSAQAQEKYPWDLTAPSDAPGIGSLYGSIASESEASTDSAIVYSTDTVEIDRLRAVSASSDYTAVDFDFIQAKSKATITLPEYPKDNSIVVIRNGDGSEIGLNGNGRLINGQTTGKIKRKGTAIELYYFIDDNAWYAK